MQSLFGTTSIYIDGSIAKSGLPLPLVNAAKNNLSTYSLHSSTSFCFQIFCILGPAYVMIFQKKKKKVDITLAIQYKCQVLRNTFSTLNITEKDRFLNFQLFILCFLELFVFNINSLSVLTTKILVFPWQ